MVRDYIVYGLLAIIIGGAIVWALWAMLRPSKGQWNEHDREVGRYRAQHWKYQECVPSLKAFLLPEASDTHYWPALANAMGHETLTGHDKSSGISWRSALMESLGERPKLFISVKFPQRSDGSTAELPEVLFQKTKTPSAQTFSVEQPPEEDRASADRTRRSARSDIATYTWNITSNELGAAHDIYDSLQGIRLSEDPLLLCMHCVDDTITFVFTGDANNSARVSLTNSYIARAAQCLQIIPSHFWVL